jgi:hypothetical protein
MSVSVRWGVTKHEENLHCRYILAWTAIHAGIGKVAAATAGRDTIRRHLVLPLALVSPPSPISFSVPWLDCCSDFTSLSFPLPFRFRSSPIAPYGPGLGLIAGWSVTNMIRHVLWPSGRRSFCSVEQQVSERHGDHGLRNLVRWHLIELLDGHMAIWTRDIGPPSRTWLQPRQLPSKSPKPPSEVRQHQLVRPEDVIVGRRAIYQIDQREDCAAWQRSKFSLVTLSPEQTITASHCHSSSSAPALKVLPHWGKVSSTWPGD